MDDMAHSQAPLTGPRHAARWTFPQAALATVAAVFAVAVTPLFFASMFMTVLDLLRSSPYGAWPWVVPLAAEGCFTALFLMDVVIVLRRKPRGRLRSAPWLFAAGSLVLNFLAGHGNPASVTGHVMVTLAFFFTVIEGEEAVRKLAVADRDARIAEIMADARRYAIDVVRDRRGRLWRWRVPVLLRRDITSGRLCDEVRQAVELAVSVGRSSGWRGPVLEWVTKELRLPDEAAAADRKALEQITRSEPEAPLGVIPETVSEDNPKALPRQASKAPAKPALKLTPGRARSMTPEQVAGHVEAMLEEYGDVGVPRIKKDLHVGGDKAQQALDIARRRRLSVVPGATRKTGS